jgi:thiamine pyrophosphate-dependent acetolactate synthase large subunit-like protein
MDDGKTVGRDAIGLAKITGNGVAVGHEVPGCSSGIQPLFETKLDQVVRAPSLPPRKKP